MVTYKHFTFSICMGVSFWHLDIYDNLKSFLFIFKLTYKVACQQSRKTRKKTITKYCPVSLCKLVYKKKEPWLIKTKWNEKCNFFPQLLIIGHNRSPLHFISLRDHQRTNKHIFSSEDYDSDNYGDNNDL